jgi:hypothetical protein
VFAQEKSQWHAVVRHNPRHKLGIRQHEPENTKDEADGFAFRWQYSSSNGDFQGIRAIGFPLWL